jgi:acyl carrier protein
MNEKMNDKELDDQVFLFLSETTSVEIDNLNANNSLEIDLGISGDDASDLIVAFAERFKVDISKFKFHEYFHSEPSLFSFSNDPLKKKEFTIRNLLEASKTRVLE